MTNKTIKTLDKEQKKPKRKYVTRPKHQHGLDKYTVEMDLLICEEIADGKPLRQICREQNIAWRTVYQWLERYPDFFARFAKAREVGMDAIAEEALEIANTPLEGIETEEDSDGKVKTKRADMLGHRKLQIETRLKLLAKWNPKKYGDRVQNDVNVIKSPREMTLEELEIELSKLTSKQ